jgi:hypothetical protein
MIGIAGQYRIERRRNGRVIEQTPWFGNLVTDAGLDSFGTGFLTPLVYLGTGSTPPTVADTGLSGTLVASMGAGGAFNQSVNLDVRAAEPPAYYAQRYLWAFPVGAVVGTVAEVAIGKGSPINLLFSRALARDEDGDLAAVTFSAADQAVVHYELRQYVDLSDLALTVAINGVDRSVIVRPSSIETSSMWGLQVGRPIVAVGLTLGETVKAQAYPGALGAVTSTPGGTAVDCDRLDQLPYVAGSLKRAVSAWWNPATLAGTYPSFRTRFFYGGAYQFSVDPPMILTDRQTLRLDYECTWGRYEETP